MCLQRTLGSLNVFTKGNVFHTLHPPHPKTATPGQPPKKKKKNQNNSKKNNYLCPSPSYLVLFLPNATHEEFDHQCRRVSTVILLCGQVGSLGSWGHDVTFSQGEGHPQFYLIHILNQISALFIFTLIYPCWGNNT